MTQRSTWVAQSRIHIVFPGDVLHARARPPAHHLNIRRNVEQKKDTRLLPLNTFTERCPSVLFFLKKNHLYSGAVPSTRLGPYRADYSVWKPIGGPPT